MANPTEPDIVVTFQTFFEHWLVHQQSLLDQLLSISSDTSSSTAKEEEEQQHRHLIQQVISHYNNYLIEKFKVARFDVFLLFSPPWLSSTERTLLWIADFKPSLLFRLINGSVQDDLSEEQVKRIEELKSETIREERELMETMARIQESVATPLLVNVARRFGRLVNGEVEEVVSSAVDSAMVELKVAMLVVLGSADALRGMTVTKIMEILRPVQITKFLAAAAQFQLQIRRWGLQRDSDRTNTGFA